MVKLDYDIICRALEHYAKKFETFEDDNNDDRVKKTINLGNGFIKNDLKQNAEDTRKLAQTIKDVKSSNTIHDNKTLVNSALNVYLNDLKKSKDALMTELKENGIEKFTLTNICDEILGTENQLDFR